MFNTHVDGLNQSQRRFLRYFLLVLLVLTGIAVAFVGYQQLMAQAGANCSGQYFIDQVLPTGARWQMCWEARQLEGVVLYDVYYTPVGNATRKVLAQANLAQIHVPYDDNGARYHDSTDSGLGGSYLTDLTGFDCPGGTLLQDVGRSILCLQVQSRGYAYKYTTSGVNQGLQGYQMRLFSISHVGEYNYIAQWDFSDDGAIKPQVGATGKLQRLGAYVDDLHGWPLRTEAGQVVRGVSHTHNYYWRLDFDLGDKTNDLVEEINFMPANLNQERTISVTQFLTEAARSRNPDLMRSWRIRDKAITNSDGHYISYDIVPSGGATHYQGPDYEPFTFNDFYVTVYNPCEKFVSHNPLPCMANVSDFVNGENTDGSDLVVWYGINFHHLVRDEDENFMPAHWDNFTLSPRDWTATNPLDALSTPITGTTTPIVTPTATNTVVPTATATRTLTPTSTATVAATATRTLTPVASLTATRTPTPTNTSTVAATPTRTATPTITPTPGLVSCTVYTSTNVPAPLPNGTFNVTSTLNVPNAVTISDVNVNVNMAHTYIGDLTFILTQQSTNKSVTIIDRPGNPATSFGCAYDNIVATLGDEALLPVESQCNQTIPSINGSFKPNNPLSLFDGGQSNGIWTLKVIDNDPYSDSGTLNSWGLQICKGGEAPVGAAMSDTSTQLIASDQVPAETEKGELSNRIFLPVVTR
ncbi:MAG: proprotein convertase P-domain-containing protein [Caldilineaceae bacterium]